MYKRQGKEFLTVLDFIGNYEKAGRVRFLLSDRSNPVSYTHLDVYKRQIIARRHDIVYGKFFDKKAGFISKKWLPVFANYRRDGYDFDALYDDGKAPNKHKKIMVNFMEDNADSEIYSNELKKQAGFGKDGEKGFDGAITNLMMQTYLCLSLIHI